MELVVSKRTRRSQLHESLFLLLLPLSNKVSAFTITSRYRSLPICSKYSLLECNYNCDASVPSVHSQLGEKIPLPTTPSLITLPLSLGICYICRGLFLSLLLAETRMSLARTAASPHFCVEAYCYYKHLETDMRDGRRLNIVPSRTHTSHRVADKDLQCL